MKQILQGKAGYLVTEACIHTTATRKEWMYGRPVEDVVKAIDRDHKLRGWKGIGYHRVIHYDGSIGIGRSLWEIGAGVAGHNRGVVHIALVGGFGGSADDSFSDHYTSKQELALRAYLRELSELTPLSLISGHNQYAAKACPCFRVHSHEWLPKPVDHVRPEPRATWWARFKEML